MVFIKRIVAIAAITGVISACKKDVDPIIVFPASTGSTLQLNGLAGNEAGSSAGNTVYVDLNADKQTAVTRNSWDLGFYGGADFRVIINNTTSATAKVLAKNDLTQVGTADTTGLNKLALGFEVSAFTLVDNVFGTLSQTVIPATAVADADNKVVIINPGTGGNVSARDWYKIRVLRSVTGYKLQYAKLAAITFNTIDITKDADYNFKYISLESGTSIIGEPAKELWDFKWSYILYQTALSPTEQIPFAFSDLIMINNLAGVQAAEVLTSTVAYDSYANNNVSTTMFSSASDAIGAKWRSTQPATGAKTDRFYVLKDARGNAYKIKFLAMGAGDGGTRGKPQFEYKLVK
ncbi:MAG: HmuY family protein [Bacteroidota bacterium]